MKSLNLFLAKLMLVLSIVCLSGINTTLANPLYQADIEFESSTANISPELQQQLVLQAFSEVLIKLYGNIQIISHPDYSELLKQAPKLLEKYSFTVQNINITNTEELKTPIQPPERPENHPDETPSTIENSKKIFHASFSPATTDKLLKSKQLSIWHGTRPDTLVWLTIEENNRRTTVSNETHPELIQQMRKLAHKRNLELVFPMMDLNDQQYVSTSDLWGNFSTAIIAASKRYHTPAIINIRTYRENDAFWQVNAHLYLQDKQISWHETSSALKQVSAKSIDNLLGHLAETFKLSSHSEQKQQLLLQIHNVVSYQDYQRLQQYLSKVSVINSLQLVKLAQDKAMFNIEFIGDKQYLLQTLTLDEFLQDFSHSEQQDKSAIDLNEMDYSEVNLLAPDELETNDNTESSSIDNAKPNNLNKTDSTSRENDKTNDSIEESNLIDKQENPTVPITVLKPEMELWLRD